MFGYGYASFIFLTAKISITLEVDLLVNIFIFSSIEFQAMSKFNRKDTKNLESQVQHCYVADILLNPNPYTVIGEETAVSFFHTL